jgi:hypothetical protein
MLRLSRTTVLAALCAAFVWAAPSAGLPGAAAGAAVRQAGSGAAADAGSAAADTIRNSQRWVLDMMDVPAAWPLQPASIACPTDRQSAVRLTH